MFTDLRLKIIHFFRRNKKIIFIVICIWVIVFLVNQFLKNYEKPAERQTTLKPHTSIMDSNDSVPQSVSDPIEEMIEEYVGYCNNSEWQKAFDMLSPLCQEYSFDNSVEEFMKYVYTKMPTEKQYSIQDYSNDGDTYIYQIKYSDDLLATGLTNTTYQYTEEKMVFKKQKDGTIEMAVGNFVDYHEIKNVFENDYLKVDMKSVVQYYSLESYTVKLTNRTDYTIVIADGEEEDEVALKLNSSEKRTRTDVANDIVLAPKESITLKLKFKKFYDNGDDASTLLFNSVRVMEQYSGTANVSEEVIESEKQNAIAKFSVNVPIKYNN